MNSNMKYSVRFSVLIRLTVDADELFILPGMMRCKNICLPFFLLHTLSKQILFSSETHSLFFMIKFSMNHIKIGQDSNYSHSEHQFIRSIDNFRYFCLFLFRYNSSIPFRYHIVPPRVK